ncbi:MAG: bifunctional folylpolyglutamate synthase/dihydrofolate synthase [Saprospiraceae bacterium]
MIPPVFRSANEQKNRYQATLDYLYAQLPMYHRIGPAAFKKDLTNTLRLCEHLGNPHRQFRSVHIAGTNGKGSVAHILAAVFTACGYHTGLYTSPHYKDFRERIKIDGHLIPKTEVVRFVEKNREAFETIEPSYFEWTVALAFDYFARQKVDVAIVETGLGGRLDSTNVIDPLASIITNIGLDHQQFLGTTLPEIATEKAGIIKPGVPVVIGESQRATKPVFIEKAHQLGAPIVFADEHYKAIVGEKTDSHSIYRVLKNGEEFLPELPLNHLGDFQQKNLCTTLQALEVLAPKFPKLTNPKRISYGLGNLKQLSHFIGRWEFISHTPKILCDSAHNEEGIRQVVAGLSKLNFRQLHFVLGVVADKSLPTILPLLPSDATYYFAKANIPRGLDAGILQTEAHKYGLQGKAYTSIPRALASAKLRATPDDLIFAGGSIFTVAEVL